jgi:DNA-binding transcriptional LysR family regulator
MQHLDLTALRYFSETALTGSIRLASDRLHVTPSAVSRQIAKLEHRLATVLFERRPTGVVLTPSGQLLADELINVYGNLARVQTLIGDLEGLRRGEVTIHCLEGAVEAWLPGLIARFNDRHPHIEFAVVVSSTDRAAEALASGRCDIALMFKAPRRPDIDVVAAGSEPLVALVHPGHPLARRATTSLAELLRYPVALPDTTFGVRQVFDRHMKKARSAPQCLVTTNSIAMTRSIVRQGAAVTLLPHLSAQHDCAMGLLSAIPLARASGLRAEVDLCVRKDRVLTAAAREVLAAMKADFGNLFTAPAAAEA